MRRSMTAMLPMFSDFINVLLEVPFVISDLTSPVLLRGELRVDTCEVNVVPFWKMVRLWREARTCTSAWQSFSVSSPKLACSMVDDLRLRLSRRLPPLLVLATGVPFSAAFDEEL